MSFVIGGNNPVSTGYNLTRSLRFRSSASAYLNRTMTAGTSVQKGTQSFWVKRGVLATTINVGMCAEAAVYPSGGAFNVIQFTSSDTLQVQCYNGSSNDLNLITTQVFRDPSAWYHIVVAWDTTQATAANRAIVYVNGTQVTAFSTATYPAQNTNFTGWGASNYYTIGADKNNSNVLVRFFDGYLAEFNYVDGQQLAVTSFGSTNALTGVWQPARYTGTYGTNGFYLPFTDNSALTTSSNVGLGKDFSGNGNYWTTNNISITAGTTYDSMTDVPTLTSATAANFAVLNPLDVTGVTGRSIGGTISDANLTWSTTTSSTCRLATFRSFVGDSKWYAEAKIVSLASATSSLVGIMANGGGNYLGRITLDLSASVGDIINVAYDPTTGKIFYGVNNTWVGSGNPATGANPFSTLTGTELNGAVFAVGINTVVSGTTTFSVNFGQQPFTYTPPTGFVALNTYNLPTSTIVKGNTVMDATLYTGTGAAQNIVNAAAFKPDLVWFKCRSIAYNNNLFDSVRGAGQDLRSNLTNAESTTAEFTSFNSNGWSFSGVTTNGFNDNGATYVGWQWQAGQGSTSSNTNGSITSTVSVNASAGFSVVTWTGTGANATVGHGLGVAPQLIINKPRNAADNWISWHTSLGALGYIYLNLTNASNTLAAMWNSTLPTSSVFSVGTNANINSSAQTMVSYCWTPIAGFSAFGSYTGNGSTDGVFVYTGFRPRWILWKRSSGVGNWILQDTARSPYNASDTVLFPELSDAESVSGGYSFDILSNGFKLRNSATYANASGSTYIYMAFAENPLKNALAR